MSVNILQDDARPTKFALNCTKNFSNHYCLSEIENLYEKGQLFYLRCGMTMRSVGSTTVPSLPEGDEADLIIIYRFPSTLIGNQCE